MFTEPAYKWRPKFVPGPTPCTIETHAEKRARLIAGGTFFRSKTIGSKWNSANLQIIVSTLDLGGFNNPTPSDHPTWSGWGSSVMVVELTVTHTATEHLSYYYSQQGQTSLLPPPECVRHAPSALRAVVNADTAAIIEMPTNDVQAPWAGGVSGDDEKTTCLLSPFSSTLSGGESGPDNPSELRTGPMKSVFYVSESEKYNSDGSLTPIQELREYNGTDWIPYS